MKVKSFIKNLLKKIIKNIIKKFLERDNGVDSSVFWMSTYINFFAWLGLFIWEAIRLKFVWVNFSNSL